MSRKIEMLGVMTSDNLLSSVGTVRAAETLWVYGQTAVSREDVRSSA